MAEDINGELLSAVKLITEHSPKPPRTVLPVFTDLDMKNIAKCGYIRLPTHLENKDENLDISFLADLRLGEKRFNAKQKDIELAVKEQENNKSDKSSVEGSETEITDKMSSLDLRKNSKPPAIASVNNEVFTVTDLKETKSKEKLGKSQSLPLKGDSNQRRCTLPVLNTINVRRKILEYEVYQAACDANINILKEVKKIQYSHRRGAKQNPFNVLRDDDKKINTKKNWKKIMNLIHISLFLSRNADEERLRSARNKRQFGERIIFSKENIQNARKKSSINNAKKLLHPILSPGSSKSVGCSPASSPVLTTKLRLPDINIRSVKPETNSPVLSPVTHLNEKKLRKGLDRKIRSQGNSQVALEIPKLISTRVEDLDDASDAEVLHNYLRTLRRNSSQF